MIKMRVKSKESLGGVAGIGEAKAAKYEKGAVDHETWTRSMASLIGHLKQA